MTALQRHQGYFLYAVLRSEVERCSPFLLRSFDCVKSHRWKGLEPTSVLVKVIIIPRRMGAYIIVM